MTLKKVIADLRCKLEHGVVNVVENVDESMLEPQVEFLAVSETRFHFDSAGACISSLEGAL